MIGSDAGWIIGVDKRVDDHPVASRLGKVGSEPVNHRRELLGAYVVGSPIPAIEQGDLEAGPGGPVMVGRCCPPGDLVSIVAPGQPQPVLPRRFGGGHRRP
ncbi:Uncharacterised protein [Mycobacteroides abscessus subsp. massiliense]|nr:Uncharacterised protein [Mycobacteroides abscessus subsp. massiliense]